MDLNNTIRRHPKRLRLLARLSRVTGNRERGSCIFAFMESRAVSVLLIASALALGQAKPYPKPQVPAALDQVAPDFTLKDQDGKEFHLADKRGHWVLLFFYRGYW